MLTGRRSETLRAELAAGQYLVRVAPKVDESAPASYVLTATRLGPR